MTKPTKKHGPLDEMFGRAGEKQAVRRGEVEATEDRSKPEQFPNHIAGRMAAGKQNTRGAVQKKKSIKHITQRWVDPSTCRMWANHNRRYDLLSTEHCRDLIGDIRANGQQLPAIVREIHGDPDFAYEVICGARRHWVAAHLQKEYLIEVKQLSDEEAFRLSDSENRSRKDISDYERALDYAHALKTYYQSQRKMAAVLDVKETWLSEFLALAEMPKEVLSAYSSLTDIKARHGAKLRPLLNDEKKSAAVIAKANDLAKVKELQGRGPAGGTVFKELVAAAKGSTRQARGHFGEWPYKGSNGKLALRLKSSPRGGLQIVFEKDSKVSVDELVELSEKALRAYLD